MKNVRWQIKNLNHFTILFFAFIFLNALSVFAGPNRTTYQAKIVKPDGYPLEAASVNFKFTILDPAGACILYSETYSAVNMTSTGGLISFSLGSGVKTYPVSSPTFEDVFSNITPSLSCDVGGPVTYSPAANDIRKIVMQFHDGAGWQTLPAMNINAVPYAMYANDAQKLGGLNASAFVQNANLPSCIPGEALHYNGTSFTCVNTSSVSAAAVVAALGYTPAIGTSVTALTSALSTTDTTVASVSSSVFSVSSTVSSLANSVSSLQSATAASFAAITSSQWVTSGTTISYSTGNVIVSGGLQISMDVAACSANLAGTLRYNNGLVEYCNGTSWAAFGVAGAGINLINGSSSGTQTFVTGISGTNFGISSVNGVHTFNIPLAASGSVTAGLLSNADYVTFTNKLNATSAAVISALGYTPASATTVATLASDLATVSSAVAANTANINSVSSAVATNAANINAVSSTVASLSSSTAASFAAITSSQWITSGSTIRYSTGNVGIGITAPVTRLDVSGGVRISMESAVCAAGYAGTLRYNSGNVEYCNGTSWSAFGVAGAGINLMNGSASGSQTFVTGITGTVFNISTVNGVHTFNIPLAASGSVTAGLLSNADYVTFTNKLNATSAAVISALGYTPADNAASGTYVVKANNLSDLASATVARTNLGLGSIALLNFIDLSGSQASGTLAAARLPAFSGDATSTSGSAVLTLASVGAGVTSGTQYTKVTVDGKGRVTSGSALTSADVTTALGFTPASATALGNYVVRANNLSDLTSSATARTNLGVGYIGTLASVDLGSADVSGTLAIARTPSYVGDVTKAVASNTLVLSNTGVVSGTYTKVTVDTKGRVISSSALTSSDVTTALGFTPGAAASGVTLLNGSASQTQTFAVGTTGTAPLFNTANGVHTLNIPLASAGSVTGGLLSNADYSTFMNKITSSAASIAQVLGYVPASATALGSYAVRANNLSDLASATVARTNLGLGSLAVLNTVDLSGSQASGTLAAARLPAFSGDASSTSGSAVLTLASVGAGVTSGTQYTKVTVDGKGRVTSGAQLSTSDVTTALGYTPASASASTQWTTSGTTINYMTGNVGIGTTNPTYKLDVVAAGSDVARFTGNQVVVNATAGNPNFSLYESNVLKWSMGNIAADDRFRISNESAVERFTVLQNGTVGIGTATPQTKLDVVGSQTAIRLTDTGTGVATEKSTVGGLLNSFEFFYDESTTSVVTGRMSSINYNTDGTGWYGITSRQDAGLGFSTISNGVLEERVRISDVGNVGIGMTNPTARLTLVSGTSSLAPFKFTSGTLLATPQAGAMEYIGTGFYLTDGTGTRRMITTGSNPGSIDNASIINSTGNITMVPVGSVVVSSTTASTNSSTGALIVNGGLGVAGNIFSSGTIITSSNIQGASITATSGLIAPYIYGGTSSSGHLTIDPTTHANKGNIFLAPNGGKIGIGYTSPLAKLHIGGSISGAYRSWMDNGMIVGKTGDSDGGYFGLKDEGAARQDTVIAWGDDSNDYLRFINVSSGGVSDGVEIMRMTPQGNVGIGLTNPTQQLTTSGNVLVGSGNYPALFLRDTSWWMGLLRSTQTSWPDADSFVFSTPTGRPFVFQHGAASQTEATPLMYIDTSGSVAVGGVTTPLEVLDVNGSMYLRGDNVYMSHDAATNTNNDYFGYDDSAVLGAAGIFSFFADGPRDQAWTAATGAIAAKSGYFVSGLSVGTSATTKTLEVNGSMSAAGLASEQFSFTVDGVANATYAIGSLTNNTKVTHVNFEMTVHNGSTIDALRFQVSLPSYSNGTLYSNWQELPVAFGSSAWDGRKNYVIDVYRITPNTSGGMFYFRVRNKMGFGSSSTMTLRMSYNSDATFTRISHTNTTGTAFNAGTAAAGGPVDGMYGALEYSFPVATGQAWKPADNTGLFIKNSGFVGIGTSSPSEMLEVSGSVKAVSYLYTSDRRLKKDIVTLPDALANVLKLRGVNFVWKNNDEKTMGFIAQEVEAVFPELVKTDKNTGFKAVQYGNIVAILVEAIKQENKERLEAQNSCETKIANVERAVASANENSSERINQLEKENQDLKSRLEKIEKFLNEKTK